VQVLGLQAFASQVGERSADADDDFDFRRFAKVRNDKSKARRTDEWAEEIAAAGGSAG